MGDQRRPRTGIRAAPVKRPHQLPDEAGPPIRPRLQAGRAPNPVVRPRHGHLEPAFRLRRRRLRPRQQAENQYERGHTTCHGILGHRQLPRLTAQRHGAPRHRGAGRIVTIPAPGSRRSAGVRWTRYRVRRMRHASSRPATVRTSQTNGWGGSAPESGVRKKPTTSTKTATRPTGRPGADAARGRVLMRFPLSFCRGGPAPEADQGPIVDLGPAVATDHGSSLVRGGGSPPALRRRTSRETRASSTSCGSSAAR